MIKSTDKMIINILHIKIETAAKKYMIGSLKLSKLKNIIED
jgi:hypothetical protein